MNTLYVKAILYSYPNIDKRVEYIDRLVLKKALYSRTDFRSVEEISEEIITLMNEKDILIKLKTMVECGLRKFKPIDLDHFDYKFFHIKKDTKDYSKDFKPASQYYYCKLKRLLKRFIRDISWSGFNNLWFEENVEKSVLLSSSLRRAKNAEASEKLQRDNYMRIRNLINNTGATHHEI